MPQNTILNHHERYMRLALTQAEQAFTKDEVPVGAIIVAPEGHILAQAYNQTETLHSQTAHAEMLAIAHAGQILGDWRLEDCWLYVTLEPCAMCMNAILISRFAGLVYGASSPLFGYLKVDKEGSSWLYKRDALTIVDGICEQEAQQLLKQFFKKKRVRE
ncbi:MAG: tRNA-specific adenosine deaminase [Candidatus Babeliales bacterium]